LVVADVDVELLAAVAASISAAVGLVIILMLAEVIDLLRGQDRESEDAQD
jgi:hypothetical protein